MGKASVGYKGQLLFKQRSQRSPCKMEAGISALQRCCKNVG